MKISEMLLGLWQHLLKLELFVPFDPADSTSRNLTNGNIQRNAQ
jgi:hypothetical protein